MKLYYRLPLYLQEMALSVYAHQLEKLYYGPGYKEWYQQVMTWQAASRAQAENWQSQQLRSLIQVAGSQVPYYRNAWKGVAWNKVSSAQDLMEIPLLHKQSIRQNEQAFVVEGVDIKTLWVEKTSGTTGTFLKIFWPKTMVPKWWALTEVMVRQVAGVGQAMPRAMMGGRPIVRGNQSCPPYWRYNKQWKQLYLSSYHVSRETVSGYVHALRHYQSQWLTGYGSAIAALAETALEMGEPFLPLRSIIVSGDTLLPRMRASIQKYFGCKCFDHYGQCEGVCMAMECIQGRMHVIPWVGILEILREDGSPCAPGEVGEMVGTSLLNDAMPLIRYRLGDYAAWAVDQSCPCGNPHPIIKNLEGRVDDYLVAEDGRKIGRLSTAMKGSPSIHSAQIVQDHPGHAYLLVRPGEGYCFKDAVAIREDILERIGTFDLETVEVAEIPRTPQGKTALVVRLAERPGMQEIYEKLLTSKKKSA